MRTQEFALAVGETYTVVRNVYGRPGRAPREAGAHDASAMRKHRRFVVADALAWRLTRDLCDLGLTWDEAAPIVHREAMGDRLAQSGALDGIFFATWPCLGGWAAWVGTAAEIAEMIEVDRAKYGPVPTVRMVELGEAFRAAVEIAAGSGYRFDGGQIVRDAEALP